MGGQPGFALAFWGVIVRGSSKHADKNTWVEIRHGTIVCRGRRVELTVIVRSRVPSAPQFFCGTGSRFEPHDFGHVSNNSDSYDNYDGYELFAQTLRLRLRLRSLN